MRPFIEPIHIPPSSSAITVLHYAICSRVTHSRDFKAKMSGARPRHSLPRTKRPNYGLDEAGPSHVRGGGRLVRRGQGRPGGRGGHPAPPPDDGLMDNIRERAIIQEEPIASDELTNTPIPQQIHEMGWEVLAARRVHANINIVREFYHSIDPDTYRTEGVMVRGVRVEFNPEVINRHFGTRDFPNYFRGFPYTNDYVGPITSSVAEELRMYPMKPWRNGRKQNIDHRELSTDLAFWNDFVSHSIFPKVQYQKLRNYHPKIILAINRAEPFDVGFVMCASLDWHLLRRKQIVLPCTITEICQLAGINIDNPLDVRLRPMEAMGSRCFARMAGTRADPGYLMGEEEENEDEDDSDAGEFGAERGEGGQLGAVLTELRDGQSEIMNRLDGFGNCLWNMGSRLTGIEELLRGANIGNEGNMEHEDIPEHVEDDEDLADAQDMDQ